MAGGGAGADYVPPFRAAERQRAYAGATGRAWVGSRVLLGAGWSWLRDQSDSGEVSMGAGDLHLGAAIEAVRFGTVHGYLGWAAKLPNAADEGELGTDETDVTVGGGVGWSQGPWSAAVSAGLAVLGNPLKFANQDDVPVLRVEGSWRHGPWELAPRLAADFATSRNPARARVGGAVRAGKRFFGEASGYAGLTPAEASWQFGLAVGARTGLPGAGERE